MSKRRSYAISWTIILALCTFSLSMSGTFLVRSGILNSVHTFANDPERGIFILTFLFILVFLSVILFFSYQENDKNAQNQIHVFSKETSILVNNWFMMYFLSVVLIGTIYPIFIEVLINEKISIGPPFYNKLLIPFLIPFLIFMSIGPNFRWIKDNFKKINYLRIFLFIICLSLSYFIIKDTSLSILISTILGDISTATPADDIISQFSKLYSPANCTSLIRYSIHSLTTYILLQNPLYIVGQVNVFLLVYLV